MEEEKIYSVTEPVGSEQDAPVSNMEMLSDVFFKEEARRLKEAFCFERDADDLDYLNHQLQSVKNLLVGLKLPWIQIAPILYRCMAVYLQRPDQHVSNMKVRYLSTQLMDGFCFYPRTDGSSMTCSCFSTASLRIFNACGKRSVRKWRM